MKAVIDIGSNSVRLMLWADGKTLYKKVCTTRLGEGIAHSCMLSEEAMARTVCAVARFAAEAREQNAEIYAFATAAVRAAKNAETFCEKVFSECGVGVDVVSGDVEAELGMLGALGNGDGGIVDVGGASTEICVRQGGERVFSVSLPIGAVRLFDACGDNIEKLSAVVQKELSHLSAPRAKTYIIGGTASTLASVRLGLKEYDGAALNELPLSAVWLMDTADRLLRMSAEERKKIPGMDVQRADIIGCGALILASVVRTLGLGEVCFSDRDNLEGYLAYRGLS